MNEKRFCQHNIDQCLDGDDDGQQMDVDYEQKIHSPYIRSFVQFHG